MATIGGALLGLGMALGCAASTSSTAGPAAAPLGLDRYRPIPQDNLLTPAKVALGRRLFRDPALSRDGRVACATCHDPQYAFTDGRRVSLGVFGRQGRRNVPTLVNRVYGASFFWDGRETTLEEQVLRPIEDPLEMGMTVAEVTARIRSSPGYRAWFRRAFGRDPTGPDLARALASYVRTILSGDSPFDRELSGKGEPLAPAAIRGLDLFRGRAGCSACHVGPNLTDEQFHNTGVAWRDGAFADPGRAAITGASRDLGAFKTPTLRDVARTAPYMHDGSLATLEEVVDFYDRGGNANPHLDAALHPLGLSGEDKQALAAFLQALSGRIREGTRRRSQRASGESSQGRNGRGPPGASGTSQQRTGAGASEVVVLGSVLYLLVDKVPLRQAPSPSGRAAAVALRRPVPATSR